METQRSKVAIGCMIPIAIFLVIWISASVYTHFNDEQTKQELMQKSEAEAHLQFPKATDIMAYNMEMSKGVETFSSLAVDTATIHVSMKIDSKEVRMYFWWDKVRGEKEWILMDIRE